MLFIEAIAHQEGYYNAPTIAHGPTGLVTVVYSRPYRNHNPGDLIWGSETKSFGALSGDPTFAVFPDIKTGWKALARWLSIPAKFDATGTLIAGYLGATLQQVIFRFAPPFQNNSQAYVDYVVAQTGLSSTTILTKDLLSTPQA